MSVKLLVRQNGGVAQLARACGSYPQCQEFKSLRRHQYDISPLLEQSGRGFFCVSISYGTTSADSDTNGAGGAQSFKSKSNIWNMGVTVEKSFNNADNGVSFVPYAGLRYMNVNNGEYTDSIGFRHHMNKGSFTGIIGLEAQYRNCTYGVSFAYQKGSHQDSKKIMADFKLTF